MEESKAESKAWIEDEAKLIERLLLRKGSRFPGSSVDSQPVKVILPRRNRRVKVNGRAT